MVKQFRNQLWLPRTSLHGQKWYFYSTDQSVGDGQASKEIRPKEKPFQTYLSYSALPVTRSKLISVIQRGLTSWCCDKLTIEVLMVIRCTNAFNSNKRLFPIPSKWQHSKDMKSFQDLREFIKPWLWEG